MKPFTPQQLAMLQAIGDGTLSVTAGFGFAYRYHANGVQLHGRGLTATFDGLVKRLALVPHGGSLQRSPWRVSDEAKQQLAEYLALPVCPSCDARVRTTYALSGDTGCDPSRRFFVRHRDQYGLNSCAGSRQEVQP